MSNKLNITQTVNKLSPSELALYLYHISAHNKTSKTLTAGFCDAVILKASEIISGMLQEGDTPTTVITTPDAPENVERHVSHEYTAKEPEEGITLCHWHKNCGNPVNSHPCVRDASVICHCCGQGTFLCGLKVIPVEVSSDPSIISTKVSER